MLRRMSVMSAESASNVPFCITNVGETNGLFSVFVDAATDGEYFDAVTVFCLEGVGVIVAATETVVETTSVETKEDATVQSDWTLEC